MTEPVPDSALAKARALINLEATDSPDLAIDRWTVSIVLVILDAYFLLGTYPEDDPSAYRERVHRARLKALGAVVAPQSEPDVERP